MIKGIGTDIVQINRIQETLARLGEKFAQRILTPAELLEFQQSSRSTTYLAKRFAAKEAAGKALGTGIGQGVSWQHIEIQHTDTGAPVIVFSAQAQQKFLELGATVVHISIADEKEYAVAFVTLS